MDRRRGVSGKQRPATSGELQLWSQTFTSLNNLARLQSGTIGNDNKNLGETTARVNKWMSSLPQDEALQIDSFETLKGVKGKLVAGLNDIKSASEKEASAIEETLDHLTALIALRKGDERRVKRIRMSSPSSGPGSPLMSSGASLNGVSSVGGTVVSNGRTSSLGPQALPRDARGKREFLAAQLPLKPGRKVAFRQPPQDKGGNRLHDASGGDGDGETWIMAVVRRNISGDKNRYEVQDDDTEDGEPGQKYMTHIKNLLPLPDPDASDISHPSNYEEYPIGTAVMGLYPDTSCFYRAIVVAGPRDPLPGGGRTVSSTKTPSYRLRFEDDDDQVRAVGVQWVVEAPP